MWNFTKPINLIRYLIVWRVNRSLVWQPKCLSAEISLVLGAIITNRLPTREARSWRKALAPWEAYQVESSTNKKKSKAVPEVLWPIEAVLFVYPGKLNHGQGELILWELKLLGEHADHGLFLEVILPAMEEAGSTADPQWHHQHNLWGCFDVHSVYVARGTHWEPVVKAGKLDLSYRATPTQWADGLTFGVNSERTFNRLTWLTPFDLVAEAGVEDKTAASSTRSPSHKQGIPPYETPTLQGILEALMARMTVFLPGKYNTPGDVWRALSPEEQSSLQDVIEQVYHIPVRRKDFELAPKHCPGRWTGTQTFSSIPPAVIPYLELASILHIGRQTHFGCGTFMVT